MYDDAEILRSLSMTVLPKLARWIARCPF